MANISVDTLYNRATGQPVSTGTGVKAFTGTASNYPDALAGDATYIVQCTEACHINFAATATSADPIYFAYIPYVVHLPKATSTYTASVIQSSAGGSLYISKLTPDRI